jgi:hypothetical protein
MVTRNEQDILAHSMQHGHHSLPEDVVEVDLDEIWRVLREVEMLVKLHLEREEKMWPKVAELINLLERSKGALTLLKWISYVVAPLFFAIYWVRDHVRL